MEQHATQDPPRSGAPETLRDYLAGSDATCPSCRYNLRGCETATCPECGWGLQLQLRPRLATVPHWLFGLMIFGWLALMGVAGTVSQVDRFWNYYHVTSNRWMRQNNRAQSQAIIQQFLNQQPGGAGVGVGLLPSNSTGALATPVMPPMPTLAESMYNYFIALMAQDQVSCLIFIGSAAVGLGGLALIPVSRRCSPRFNTVYVAVGSMLFGLLALNYLCGYVLMWMRRF
jgi:hypothetical protein